MLDEQNPWNPIGEYRWECPYRDCKFFLLKYTSEGYEEKIRKHRDHHIDVMKEERAERNKNKNWPFPPKEEPKLKSNPNRDYNKLVLTLYDIIQFELRHIQIDNDCVIEGYNGPN